MSLKFVVAPFWGERGVGGTDDFYANAGSRDCSDDPAFAWKSSAPLPSKWCNDEFETLDSLWDFSNEKLSRVSNLSSHHFDGKGGGDVRFSCKCLLARPIWRWSVITVIVRTVSQPGTCIKIVCHSQPPSPQNCATTIVRLATVCGFLVFYYAGTEVAKYQHSMWKILVGLEKFTKVSESLIMFLLKLEKKLLKFCFDFTSAWSDSTRHIWPHAVRQHLIRPRHCVNMHFIPYVISDCVRSWDRAKPRPHGRPH